MTDLNPNTLKGRQPIDILLVEDEEADAELIQRAFEKAGLVNPIHRLQNGEEALDYLFGRDKYADRDHYPLPGLVLLDLKLPRVSGLEVLKQLQQSTETVRRIPMVVLTSSSQPSDINRAYDFGANSYLVKPVQFAAFCQVASEIKLYWLLLNKHPDLE